MFNITILGNLVLYETGEKYYKSEQAMVENMAHAHYKLESYVYRHKIRICNT